MYYLKRAEREQQNGRYSFFYDFASNFIFRSTHLFICFSCVFFNIEHIEFRSVYIHKHICVVACSCYIFMVHCNETVNLHKWFQLYMFYTQILFFSGSLPLLFYSHSVWSLFFTFWLFKRNKNIVFLLAWKTEIE